MIVINITVDTHRILQAIFYRFPIDLEARDIRNLRFRSPSCNQNSS